MENFSNKGFFYIKPYLLAGDDFEYSAYQSLKAGTNSRFSILRSDGKESAFDFDSMEEAQSHIDYRLKTGQDPMCSTVNEEAMINYYLNN